LAPHHLFNIVDPDEDFSLAQYQKLAAQAIREIQERNKMPILVGGSGQYIWALLEGWEIPRIPPDMAFRKNLENIAAAKGIDELYQRLLATDPVAAQKIDKRNVRRVIRALEVSQQAKIPFSQLKRRKDPGFKNLITGLTVERSELYRRLDFRVDQMIQRGLVSETEKLRNMGYDLNLPAMNSIGYKQIGMVLRGEISLEEAIKQIKVDNHRFVRHQYAWFRLKDGRIHWFDAGKDIENEVAGLIENYFGI